MTDPPSHQPERLDRKKDKDDPDNSLDLCLVKSDETSEIPFEHSERTLSVSSLTSSTSLSSDDSKGSIIDIFSSKSSESLASPSVPAVTSVTPDASTTSTTPAAVVTPATPVSTDLTVGPAKSNLESKSVQDKYLLTRNGTRSTWEPAKLDQPKEKKKIAKRARSRSTSKLNPYKKTRKTYEPCKLGCQANFCGCSAGHQEKPYLLAPLDLIEDSIKKSQYRHKFLNELNSFSLDSKFLIGLVGRDRLKLSRKARATTLKLPKETGKPPSKEMKCIRLTKSIDLVIKVKSDPRKEDTKGRIERIINDLKSLNISTDPNKLMCSSCSEKFCGCVSPDEFPRPEQIHDFILRDQYFFKIIYEFVDNEFQNMPVSAKASPRIDEKTVKEEIIEAIEKKGGIEPSPSLEEWQERRSRRRSIPKFKSKSKSKSKSRSKSRSRSRSVSKSRAGAKSKSKSKSEPSSTSRRSPRFSAPKKK